MSVPSCQQAIKSMIHNRGPQVLESPRMFRSLLMDYLPQSRRTMNLMLFGLQAGVARELNDCAESVVPKTVVERLKYKLNQEYGIEEELAYWVVQEWAGVLDKQLDAPLPVPAKPVMPPPLPPSVPQTVLPPRIAKPRRYFAVISTTALITVVLCVLIAYWVGNALPDEDVGVGAGTSNKSEPANFSQYSINTASKGK